MLFGRRAGSDPDAVSRAEESLQAIEAGGLPLAAQERLAKLRGGERRSFTSDLSTAEFLLLRQAGFRPITQVMGSCFYTVGWQYMPYGSSSGWGGGFGYSDGQIFELETQTQAWQEARGLALSRLAEEARLAGAHAVVGVELRRTGHEWAHGLIEFVATGTAVTSERYDLGDEQPVLSNLSGQDFAKLTSSGYWPVGIVAGTTVTYAMTGWSQKWSSGMFAPNQELPDFTRGFMAARNAAMQRLTREAHELGASGIVDLDFDVEQREREREDRNDNSFTDLIITVHAIGTAITEIRTGTEPAPVYIALNLDEENR